MKITTKDIIKILPLDQEYKSRLLNNFDGFNADVKFEIEQLLWDAYAALYKLRLEENIKKAMVTLQNSQLTLGPDFYKTIQEQTAKEIEQSFYKTTTDTDLAHVRSRLEEVINKKPN